MRKLLILVVAVALIRVHGMAQVREFYFSSGGEIIFSGANVDYPDNSDGVVMRFSPVFNWQSLVNYDLSKKFGLFAGLAIRNQGFIYKFPNDETYLGGKKIKFRTYNLGIPIGFKVGNLEKLHFYAGYELEFPFHYKEKWFENDDKTKKISAWFTSRTPTIYNALYAGFEFPYGANLKFKYYLTNFHNRGFTLSDGADAGIQPYKDLSANVFYVSLSFFLFKNTDLYYNNYDSKKESISMAY